MSWEDDVKELTTTPVWLVELGYSPILYASSRQLVYHFGVSKRFLPTTGLQVSGLAVSANNVMTGQLSFSNEANAFSALALSHSATLDLNIWVTFKPDEFIYNDDAVLVFKGKTDGVTQIGDRVAYAFTSSTGALLSPRQFYREPLCNHIPPPKTKITWGNNSYIVE